MENPIYVGLSRQQSLQRQLEVVANNIANMDTAGFRGERMAFAEMVVRPDGAPRREAISFGTDRASYMDERQGGFVATGNPLDLAIQGDGWFSYQTPGGTLYGRDGRLSVDAQGRLVTVDGHPVLDDGGAPVQVPQDGGAISVSGDGVVSAGGAAVARLALSRFESAQRLERVSGGLFAAPEGVEALPAAGARVAQGMLERSNVQAVVEMARMIELHRAYDSTAKLVENAHDLQRDAVSRLGKQS